MSFVRNFVPLWFNKMTEFILCVLWRYAKLHTVHASAIQMRHQLNCWEQILRVHSAMHQSICHRKKSSNFSNKKWNTILVSQSATNCRHFVHLCVSWAETIVFCIWMQLGFAVDLILAIQLNHTVWQQKYKNKNDHNWMHFCMSACWIFEFKAQQHNIIHLSSWWMSVCVCVCGANFLTAKRPNKAHGNKKMRAFDGDHVGKTGTASECPKLPPAFDSFLLAA